MSDFTFKLFSSLSEKDLRQFAMLLLTALLAVTVPISTCWTIERSLKPISERIDSLEDIQAANVVDSGIAAYKKFDGLTGQDLIDKLEGSTQNTVCARTALRFNKSYNILNQLNPELTKELIAYFGIDISHE